MLCGSWKTEPTAGNTPPRDRVTIASPDNEDVVSSGATVVGDLRAGGGGGHFLDGETWMR